MKRYAAAARIARVRGARAWPEAISASVVLGNDLVVEQADVERGARVAWLVGKDR